MPVEMSNRVILITEKPRITTPIKLALNSMGLEIVSDYPALTSVSVMSSGISKSGKTAFIRTALLRFIKEEGFPRAIIMDSEIDLSLGAAADTDTFKILKTFLIAYVILSKGVEHKNLHGNFILLTKGTQFGKDSGIEENPHVVMDMLSTQNPEINIFINELKDNPDRFHSLFSIQLLDTELSSDIIRESIVKFLAGGKRNTSEKPDKNP